MKKNVAIIITRLDLGGAQKVALALYEKLDRNKFNVHLIAGRGGILDSYAEGKEGVQLWDEIKHPVSPLNDLKASFKMAEYFRENKIDIVNTHSSKAGIIGRLAAKLAGIREVFHTVHGFSFHEYQNPLMHFAYLFIEWVFAPYTKKFIAVGEDVKYYGIKNTVGRPYQYKVIRAAVDTELFVKKRNVRAGFLEKAGLKPGNFTVGMIGNLKKQKNPSEFIETAAIACAKDQDIQFVFAGGGSDEQHEAMETLIKKYGLEKRVILLGWVDKPEDFLASIDVFFLTSLWEGLACTLVQAYCAGLPCVATNIPGNSEFIGLTGCGSLYEPGNYESAASALLGSKGKKIEPSGEILAEFDEKGMVNAYEKEFLGA